MPRLVPCVITHGLPGRWWHDGTGGVDQSVNTPELFHALRNEVSSIPTTGAIRLHRHGLDSFVKHRITRLTCAIVGVEVVPRYVHALLVPSKSHVLADAAT